MLIGDRVAERMQGQGLSQAELARRIGISQQAVGKLVHGNSRSSTHLHRIARELGTTPAYLSGEVDDPNEDAPPAPELSWDHRQLLGCFDDMNAIQRQALLTIAHSMVGRAPGGSVHAPPKLIGES